jgi:hypothetical protein
MRLELGREPVEHGPQPRGAALEPLTPEQRGLVVDTMRAYEAGK